MTQLSSPPLLHDKLLTILIPVYNGEKYLRNLLRLFVDAYSEMPDRFANVEIIVGNNVSTDGTQTVAESFRDALPILRPLSLSPHLPTAELNFFRAFCQCRGTFTWALGVDDIPVFSNFGKVIDQLEAGQADFYLFNFAVVSSQMTISRSSVFHMNQSKYPINVVDVTQRFGFWFTVAGISGQIMRTALVKDYDLPKMYDITNKIYLHVAAYLECFRLERTVVVNLPIVFYKTAPNDFAHWRKAAKLMGVCDEYFWTLGYIRQLVHLEQKGVIDSSFLHYMLETNEKSFFRPVFIVAEKFSNQVLIMSKTDDTRNHLSEAEFDEVADYLSQKEPFLREYLWKLREIFILVLEKKDVNDEAWDQLKKVVSVFADFPLASTLQYTHGDYEIYRVAKVFYAVHRDSRDVLLDRLCYFFDEEFPPEVFCGDSADVLIEKINAYYDDIDSHDRIGRKQSFKRSRAGTEREAVLSAELEVARLDLATAQKDFHRASQNFETAQRDYFMMSRNFETVTKSTSWVITKPLRVAGDLIRRLIGR